jgi:hypothetical protein
VGRLPLVDQVRAGIALGLVSVDDIADEAGRTVDVVVAAWALEDAVGVWDD